MKKQTNISYTLLINNLFIILSLFTVGLLFIVYSYKNIYEKDIHSNMKYINYHINNSYYNKLENLNRKLMLISNSKNIEYYAKNFEEKLINKEFLRYKNSFNVLEFFNKEGELISQLFNYKIRYNTKDLSINMNQKSLFKIQKNPNTIIHSPIIFNTMLNKQSITFSLKKNNFFDETLGFIRGSVAVENLFDKNILPTNSKYQYSVFDKNNNMVFSTNKNTLIQINANKIKNGILSLVNEHYIYIEEYSYGKVAILLPLSHYENRLYNFLKISSIFFFSLLFLYIIIIFFLSKKITKPLSNLVEQIDNSDEELFVNSNYSEIITLTRAFNTKRSSLLTLNNNLEHLVSDKTKELEMLNTKLEYKVIEKTKEQEYLIASLPVSVQGYNKNGEVVYWNKKSEEVYGYSQEEAIGKKLQDLIISDLMRDETTEAIKNWFENGVEIPSGDLALIRKDGTTVYVNSNHIMSINKYNNSIMYCIDIDLTLQKELLEKDKLLYDQTKLASMGEMIGNIAHQWRQPLSVITTGITGMQMQKNFGLLSDELFENTCNNINNNAQYLSKTIDDFRNFIKGDRNKSIFSLTSNITSFLHLIEGTIKKNNITMVLNFDDEININGYGNELTQCFVNIFNNAKDALNEKKARNKLIFITTSKSENNVIIKIKDNAGGIPKDILFKVFEPYFTTKYQFQGTGLGLHITYQLIVDGMKGNIEANNVSYEYEDNNYKGAEFIIILPLF